MEEYKKLSMQLNSNIRSRKERTQKTLDKRKNLKNGRKH